MSTPKIRQPAWLTPRVLTYARWTALTGWALAFGYDIASDGVPYWRSDLLLWLAIGLLAWSIGKRNVFAVVIDFVPFGAVLVVYDYLRGISDTLGMPTWWYPQINVDKFLFFGTEPTVWLQAHLRYFHPHWWDTLVGLCYISFFFLPYVTAAALWLRSRTDFYRWTLRFVPLSFLAFGFFALIPAAPPWAAARCAPDAGRQPPEQPVLHGLLQPHRRRPARADDPTTGPVRTRGSTRSLPAASAGCTSLNQAIDEGRVSADEVAAVPSLHVGGIMLFSLFMWKRVNKWWRPLLVFYPIFMGFSLVYSGEHYVADVLAGWLCALLVHLAASRIERWRKARRAADTLDGDSPSTSSSPKDVENPCPPAHPQPATTPSST